MYEKVFYINDCYVKLHHNRLTGKKIVYVNDIKVIETPNQLFETRNEHFVGIGKHTYRLVVNPTWYGTFEYSFDLVNDIMHNIDNKKNSEDMINNSSMSSTTETTYGWPSIMSKFNKAQGPNNLYEPLINNFT